jgi:predicted  nucleic acid-binding Zn-ribbon protein
MSTNHQFIFGGSPAPAGFKFGGLQQELEDAEVHTAQLELELADALEQKQLLGGQRDKAVKAEAVARNALQQVCSSWTPSSHSATMADNKSSSASIYNKVQELETEIFDLRKERDNDKDVIEDYQIRLQDLRTAIESKESEVTNKNRELAQAKQEKEDVKKEHENTTKDLNKQLERLQADYDKLRDNVDHHEHRAAHSESMLNRAYAEQETLREAYTAELKAKHDLEAQKLDLQLRYDSLFAQWQEDQEKIEELEGRDDMVEAYEAQQRDFERDSMGQQAMIAEKERKIIVKDERIAELEDQLQRERHRNLSAADAAAEATVAAATSYADEAPPSLSGFGESLADELSEDYHDDHSNYEPYYEQQDSPRYFQVADIGPALPAVQPLTLDDVSEHFSIAPKDVLSQLLTLNFNKNTSIAPKDIPTPEFTIGGVSEYMSVAPRDIPLQSLTIEDVSEYISIAPKDNLPQSLVFDVSNASTSPLQVPPQNLTLGMSDNTSIAPMDVPPQNLTTNNVSEYLSVAPKDTPIQNLAINDVNEYMSIAPRDIPRQSLTTHFGENTSTSPKDVPAPGLITDFQAASVDTAPKGIPVPNLTTQFNETASTSPKDVPSQSLTTDAQATSQHTTPIAPAMPALTSEVAHTTALDTVPVAPSTPSLSTHVKKNTSTAPVAPSQQTLMSEIAHDTALDTAPKDIPLQSLTTDIRAASQHTSPTAPPIPALVSEIAHATALDTAPIALKTQVFTTEIAHAMALDTAPVVPTRQTLTSEIAYNTAIDTAPVTPTTPVLTPGVVQPSALDYPPLAPVAQNLTAEIIQPSALNYSPTEPTVEAPIEITTTSAGVQTTETSAQSIATRYIEVEKPQKIGFLQAILPAIAALLAFLCLWQYAQLESWETANDYNYSSSYDNRGAFGNGRYIFGVPAGMDIGSNWYTEQLAKFMSMMITRVESWAGMENVPAY